jgi:glycosyltransferase involved in cell wall biosynthesis
MTPPEMPLVSGLMTCRNRERYIAAALDSALGQTYENVEVVVSDNASTDGTPEILREYERLHPERIRVVLGNEDIGPCASRNRALTLARGELIGWLDSDDLWKPTMVEKEVAIMQARPEVGLVHGWFEAIDEAGNLIPGGQRTAPSGDLLVPLFEQGCFIGAATAIFRRRALEELGIGIYDRRWTYGDDYYTWLAISLRWETAGIDEVLASYRRHGSNLSAAHGSENHFLHRISLLREFLRDFPEARSRLSASRRKGFARHYLQAATLEAERGSRARSAWYWLQGAVRDPLSITRPRGLQAHAAAIRAKERLTGRGAST